MTELHITIKECQEAIASLELLSSVDASSGKGLDFHSQRLRAVNTRVSRSIAQLELACAKVITPQLERFVQDLRANPSLQNLQKIVSHIPFEDPPQSSNAGLQLNLRSIPQEIRLELGADVAEAERCFAAGCFRSSVILCGRILETALHRKHFELTGNDLLEKAPGIGLGGVLARLAEKGALLDPGLANQVHLVNQVRVWSVHTKQEPFTPSRNQAQAIMLYTFDAVQKLFP